MPPSFVGSYSIPNNITTIGDDAFYQCEGLTSIYIPNNVSSIGKTSFMGCSGLISIVVASDNQLYDSRNNCNAIIKTSSNNLIVGCGNTIIPNTVVSIDTMSFYKCNNLLSVTIPSSVTLISYGAFANCTNLSTVTIPSSVTIIDTLVFYDCPIHTLDYNGPSRYLNKSYFGSNINTLIVGDNVDVIVSNAFQGSANLTFLSIPSSVTTIGAGAFSNCPIQTLNYNGVGAYLKQSYFGSSVVTLTIGDNVEFIPDNAFEDCYYLSSLTIGTAITSIGSRAFSYCSGLTGTLVIPNSVTYIGSEAFFACTGLTSVTIGNSVSSIGESAFSGCTGLASIDIPNSVTSIGNSAFSGCSGLNTVTIGNSVTSIGNSAFSRCTGLNSITIPNSVTSIGNQAFYNCPIQTLNYDGYGVYLNKSVFGTSIVTLTIGDNVDTIPDNAFSNCTALSTLSIGNAVRSVGASAFSGCTGLNALTIPASVTQIGDAAFNNCSIQTLNYNADSCYCSSSVFGMQLVTVNIGENVRYIPNYAFQNCAGLTSVSLPNTLLGIGDYSFNGTAITSISLPSSLRNIGNCAFSNTGLTSVAIPNSVTSVGDYAFSNCSSLTSVTLPNAIGAINHGTFSECTSLPSMTIPNTVRSIGNNAFYGCISLPNITIPNAVETIGNSAFSGCSGATSLSLGSSLETIGSSAFSGCTSLITLSIPASVTSIGSSAFYHCTGLTSATLGDNVTSIGSSAFNGCTRLTSIQFGESIETIGAGAFRECGIIGELMIPQSVITIGERAFRECYGITEITCLGRVAPVIDNDEEYGDATFYGVSKDIVVNIPCESYNLYAGRWSYFHNFSESAFLFHAVTEDPLKGTVTVTEAPTCASPVATIVATPRNGYRFDHWSDGSTDNPYLYTVTGSMTLTAYFSPAGGNNGIDDVEATDNLKIYTRGNKIVIESTEAINHSHNQAITVYDVMGRVIKQTAGSGQQAAVEIPVTSAGVYMVKVGDQPSRKVIVRP